MKSQRIRTIQKIIIMDKETFYKCIKLIDKKYKHFYEEAKRIGKFDEAKEQEYVRAARALKELKDEFWKMWQPCENNNKGRFINHVQILNGKQVSFAKPELPRLFIDINADSKALPDLFKELIARSKSDLIHKIASLILQREPTREELNKFSICPYTEGPSKSLVVYNGYGLGLVVHEIKAPSTLNDYRPAQYILNFEPFVELAE